MKDLLVCAPGEYHSEHARRAWMVITALTDEGLPFRLITGENGYVGEPGAAIVFNSPRDREVLLTLKAQGVPALYSLGIGALVPARGFDGEETLIVCDGNAYTPDFILDRRLKCAAARLIHVDSAEQILAAERHYGATGSFLALQPAPMPTAPVTQRAPARTLLVVTKDSLWSGAAWEKETHLRPFYLDDELEALSYVQTHPGCVVFWALPSSYADTMLTVPKLGVPMLAVNYRTCAPKGPALWIDPPTSDAAWSPLLPRVYEALASLTKPQPPSSSETPEWTWNGWVRQAVGALREAGADV